MSTKSSVLNSPSHKTNGHKETAYEETPGSGFSQHLKDGPGSETEIEKVEGYTISKPWEADMEVSNGPAGSESQVEELLEETGSSATTEDTPVLDAFYASYPELIEQANLLRTEVIIGQDNRVRINPTTSYPWRAICALKITAQDNSQWIGTGWLVSPRTVITAGHCVYMHNQGGWAKSVEVIPAMNNGVRPFGSGKTATLRSVNGWIQNKNRDNDYGAIILPNSYRPGDVTGSFGFGVKTDSYLASSVLNLSGYPGDKGGNQQWFMALKPKSVMPRVITYEIDTMGGQSGAPVWILVNGTRIAVGIHTNGHYTGNSATRIVTAVFTNLQNWKNLGL